MKQIVLTLLCLTFTIHLFAKSTSTDSTATIIQSLEAEEIGKGKVTIRQDSRIESLLGRRTETTTVRNNFTVGKGLRVQIYSGNNQNTSKREASERKAVISRDMPEVETYITFKSPFWRLRAGDCRTYEEAHEILRKIKELFPQYGKETYIVKDDIKIYR
jgi:hypothetical protein